MIGRDDFVNAIGKPDRDFCNTVENTLAVIRAREERKKPRRYYMILPIAAAAAIFVMFMGMALRGGLSPKQQPDTVLAPGKGIGAAQTPMAVTPSPAPTAAEQSVIEPETPYITEQPVAEEMSDAVYTPSPRPVGTLTLQGEAAGKIIDMFNGGIAALYPGFEKTGQSMEQMGVREYLAEWIANGTYEMAVKWTEIAAPRFIPEYLADASNGREFYAVSLDVPASQERINAFVSSGDEWQRTIYDAGIARMESEVGSAVGLLTGMTCYYDEEWQLVYVEMYFGNADSAYLLWRYESYDSGSFGFELLVDEYGVYGFEDPFGDPDVSVTVEPTPGPEAETVNFADVGYEALGLDFYDIDEMEKFFMAYEQLLDSLYPDMMNFSLSYEPVVMDGIACDSLAMIRQGKASSVYACWLTLGAVNEVNDGEVYNVLNITVPGSITEDYDSLIATVDGLAVMHNGSVAQLKEQLIIDSLTDEHRLVGIKLYMADDCNIRYCELFYGDDMQFRTLWDHEGRLVETSMGEEKFVYAFQNMQTDAENKWLEGLAGLVDGLMGNSASLGIIGGADGPTQVIVGEVTSAVDGNEPDEYYLFRQGVGAELTALWPGYRFADTVCGVVSARSQKFDADLWQLTNGKREFTAAWVTRGEVKLSERNKGDFLCPALTVVMPDSIGLIDAVMFNAREGLNDIYYKCRDYVCELQDDPDAMYKGWRLAGLKVTFDENDAPMMYELFFGTEQKYYFMFRRDDDGSYVMEKEYFDEDGEYFAEYFGSVTNDLPADKLLFEYAFGQSVDALYPGNDGIYIDGGADHAEAFVKYGADSIHAWSISRGKLWDTYEYETGEAFVSVNAVMTGDAAIDAAFIADAPEWLVKLNVDVSMLTNIIVTFTPDGELYACELLYANEKETYYERWMYENGGFVIYESGGSEELR